MSDQNRDELSDKEKIDRAAFHEEVRFLKRQQWAVSTAGVLLFGALLAAIRDMRMTALDRLLVVVLIAIGVYGGWFFLDDLQDGLAKVRRSLDPNDYDAATRGVGVVRLFKSILVVSAVVVVWAVVFKLPISPLGSR
jgi:uncharacterized membrane protein